MAKFQTFQEAANHSEKLGAIFKELGHRFPPQTSEADILAALEEVGDFGGEAMPDGLQLLQALRHQFANHMDEIDLDSLTYTLQNSLLKHNALPAADTAATSEPETPKPTV